MRVAGSGQNPVNNSDMSKSAVKERASKLVESNHSEPIFPWHVGDAGEMKTKEIGYRGAWFRIEIKGIRQDTNGRVYCSLIYKDFPDESDAEVLALDIDRVTGNYKLIIRPSPPPAVKESSYDPSKELNKLHVVVRDHWNPGDLFDWWYSDCWWSAEVISVLEDGKFKIKCPSPPHGEGGEYVAEEKDMRPSLNWSLTKGWTARQSKAEGKTASVRLVRPPLKRNVFSCALVERGTQTVRQSTDSALNKKSSFPEKKPKLQEEKGCFSSEIKLPKSLNDKGNEQVSGKKKPFGPRKDSKLQGDKNELYAGVKPLHKVDEKSKDLEQEIIKKKSSVPTQKSIPKKAKGDLQVPAVKFKAKSSDKGVEVQANESFTSTKIFKFQQKKDDPQLVGKLSTDLDGKSEGREEVCKIKNVSSDRKRKLQKENPHSIPNGREDEVSERKNSPQKKKRKVEEENNDLPPSIKLLGSLSNDPKGGNNDNICRNMALNRKTKCTTRKLQPEKGQMQSLVKALQTLGKSLNLEEQDASNSRNPHFREIYNLQAENRDLQSQVRLLQRFKKQLKFGKQDVHKKTRYPSKEIGSAEAEKGHTQSKLKEVKNMHGSSGGKGQKASGKEVKMVQPTKQKPESSMQLVKHRVQPNFHEMKKVQDEIKDGEKFGFNDNKKFTKDQFEANKRKAKAGSVLKKTKEDASNIKNQKTDKKLKKILSNPQEAKFNPDSKGKERKQQELSQWVIKSEGLPGSRKAGALKEVTSSSKPTELKASCSSSNGLQGTNWNDESHFGFKEEARDGVGTLKPAESRKHTNTMRRLSPQDYHSRGSDQNTKVSHELVGSNENFACFDNFMGSNFGVAHLGSGGTPGRDDLQQDADSCCILQADKRRKKIPQSITSTCVRVTSYLSLRRLVSKPIIKYKSVLSRKLVRTARRDLWSKGTPRF